MENEFTLESVPEQQEQQPQEQSTFQKAGEYLNTGRRHIGRSLARAGETVLGAPGDLLNLGLAATNYLTGGKTPTYGQIQEKLPLSIPTSEDIRRGTQSLTGNFLEPQSEKESFADEVISDIAAFLNPGKAGLQIGKAVKKAFGGQGVKWLAKNLGAGEKGQLGAKVAFDLLYSLKGGREKLNTDATQLYNKASDIMGNRTPPTSLVKNTAEKLNQIKKKVNIGANPNAPFVNGLIDNIQKTLEPKNGKTKWSDIDTSIKTLNEHIYEHRPTTKQKVWLDQIKTTLKDALIQDKPSAPYTTQANEIYSALQNKSYVTEKIDQILDPKVLANPIIKGLAAVGTTGIGGVIGHIPEVAIGATAGLGIVEAIRLFDVMRKSPSARKAYIDLQKYALAGNAIAANKSARNLIKSYEKSENKKSKEVYVLEDVPNPEK